MTTKDNGGPAFPQMLGERYEPMSTEGMSLRDYFAIHASEEDILVQANAKTRVQARYMHADAMLAEREK